ncbi:MAG: hypothetical protein EA412_10295 [Chitinophagaceae bacterium]|nr:MAG: hypothetical protein EA412_10295 [Chitinophagaceae bacterium]
MVNKKIAAEFLLDPLCFHLLKILNSLRRTVKFFTQDSSSGYPKCGIKAASLLRGSFIMIFLQRVYHLYRYKSLLCRKSGLEGLFNKTIKPERLDFEKKMDREQPHTPPSLVASKGELCGWA